MRRYIKATPIFIMGVYKENPMNAKEPHFFGYYLVQQEFPHTERGPRQMTVSYVGKQLPMHFNKVGQIFVDDKFGIQFYQRVASPPPTGKRHCIFKSLHKQFFYVD